MFQLLEWNGALLDFPAGKVVCVGSNYADHIKEMGSATPQEPVLFIKPETALCDIRQPIIIPTDWGEVHHEVELAVLIGQPLKQVSELRAKQAIAGYGIAIDLTLRDIQRGCKQKGQPWEKSKAFDGSCPVSGFIPAAQFGSPQQAQLTLTVNGELRQNGNTQMMITPVFALISYMSRFFTLRAGDIVLTGTPAGVGPLSTGDEVTISLDEYSIKTRVI